MEENVVQGDMTQEKLKSNLPGMRENLQNLEMRHAWLVQEAGRLSKIIENQRGAIALAEQLTAQP